MDFINKAISLLGSQAKLATAAGLSQPAIFKMSKGKTRPSASSAIAIEKATNGEIKREQLRPDIFGKEAA